MASEWKEVARTNVRCLLFGGGFFLSRFSKNSRKSEFGLSGGLAIVAWIVFRKVSGSSCGTLPVSSGSIGSYEPDSLTGSETVLVVWYRARGRVCLSRGTRSFCSSSPVSTTLYCSETEISPYPVRHQSSSASETLIAGQSSSYRRMGSLGTRALGRSGML